MFALTESQMIEARLERRSQRSLGRRRIVQGHFSKVEALECSCN